MKWKQGTPIGEYQIVRELSRGTNGRLYASRHAETLEPAILVVLKGQDLNDPKGERTATLLPEIESQVKARFPSVQSIKEIWKFDDFLFFVCTLQEEIPSPENLTSISEMPYVKTPDGALPRLKNKKKPVKTRPPRLALKGTATIMLVSLSVMLALTGLLPTAFQKISSTMRTSNFNEELALALSLENREERVKGMSILVNRYPDLPETASVRMALGSLHQELGRWEKGLREILIASHLEPSPEIGRELLRWAGQIYDRGCTAAADRLLDRIVERYQGMDLGWDAVLLKKHFVLDPGALHRIAGSLEALLKGPSQFKESSRQAALRLLERARSITLNRQFLEKRAVSESAGRGTGGSLQLDLDLDRPGREFLVITQEEGGSRLVLADPDQGDESRGGDGGRIINGFVTAAALLGEGAGGEPEIILGLSTQYGPEGNTGEENRLIAGLYRLEGVFESPRQGGGEGPFHLQPLKILEPPFRQGGVRIVDSCAGDMDGDGRGEAAFLVHFSGWAESAPETRILVMNGDGEFLWLHCPEAQALRYRDQKMIIDRGNFFLEAGL